MARQECRCCGRENPQPGDTCPWSGKPCEPYTPPTLPSWHDLFKLPKRTLAPARHTTAKATSGALAGILRTAAEAQEGERNAKLYWAACRLVEGGYPPAASDLLIEAARQAGLGDHEIAGTLRSAGVNL